MANLITAPFTGGGAFPVDDRLEKSKAEMLATNDNVMPEVYLTVCKDDGQIYLYNKANPIDPQTGRYRLLEGGDGDKTFEFSQTSPSALWEIQHQLNKFPSVMVVDSAGSVVVGDITYIDTNNITISFQSAFAGKAYLN